ncbi:hypothetical protein AAFZ98_004560 [Vibrio parahaemolyticus]|nr:hypothetical protein [Vibrio parahaemolyticus]MDG3050410.1 hypothetical protein [Vibrio parahaemolyticus]
MDWESIFKVSAGFLASVGSASAIIFGLSSWLGKVWAQRILEQEKNKMAIGLESTKRELDLAKDKLLGNHSDKIAIYRMVLILSLKFLLLLMLIKVVSFLLQKQKKYSKNLIKIASGCMVI